MKYFNFLAAALLLLIYLLGNIPPSEKFNLWISSFMIPFALVVNIVLIFAGIFMKKKSTLFLVIALFFGGKYLFSTIGVKSLFRREVVHTDALSVLSYNVSALNTGYFPRMGRVAFLKADSLQRKMITWLLDSDADIKCFQEFPDLELYGVDLIKQFRGKGYEHYFSADERNSDGSRFGVLILSRFPIIATGDVMASRNGYNRIAYADIARGPDTLRIINVHLQSMQMKRFHPGYSPDFEGQSRNVKVILRRLKSGVFERSRQIRQLSEFVEASPYPVICSGDFNEMPYSYSYRILKRSMRNAFEETGRGFGFTYNGNTLSMLRIDNQFYTPALRCVAFQTIDSIRYTDHFPISGLYLTGSNAD